MVTNMQINKSNQKNKCINIGIFIILTVAIYSDILRIEGSVITFFRILIPVSVVIILAYPYWAKRFFCIIISLILLSCFQYTVFYHTIKFDYRLMSRFIFFYMCIIVVFFLVKILQENLKDEFETTFFKYILITGMGLLGINLLGNSCTSFFEGFELDNPNNYSGYMASLCPFLLVYYKSGKTRLILQRVALLIIAIALVMINDSKVALLGICFEIVLLLILNLKFKKIALEKTIRLSFPIIIMIGVILLVNINPTLHGYNFRETFMQPFIRIITLDPYPIYTTSITFRTNTTIFAIQSIFDTHFMGVGVGNTGVMLKEAFPALNPEYKLALAAERLSLHNSWLEILLDVGVTAGILFIVIIKNGIKLLFVKDRLTRIEKICVLYIFSFPIWIIGASGIYTQYYIIMTIAFLIFARKDAI